MSQPRERDRFNTVRIRADNRDRIDTGAAQTRAQSVNDPAVARAASANEHAPRRRRYLLDAGRNRLDRVGEQRRLHIF